MTWRIHISNDLPFGQIGESLLLIKEGGGISGDQLAYVVGPLVLKTLQPGDSFPREEVTMRFVGMGALSGELNDFLRAFADAAWERGIKPRALEDQKNELVATKRHLEDMRSLVWKEKKP